MILLLKNEKSSMEYDLKSLFIMMFIPLVEMLKTHEEKLTGNHTTIETCIHLRRV